MINFNENTPQRQRQFRHEFASMFPVMSKTLLVTSILSLCPAIITMAAGVVEFAPDLIYKGAALPLLVDAIVAGGFALVAASRAGRRK